MKNKKFFFAVAIVAFVLIFAFFFQFFGGFSAVRAFGLVATVRAVKHNVPVEIVQTTVHRRVVRHETVASAHQVHGNPVDSLHSDAVVSVAHRENVDVAETVHVHTV